MTVGDLRKLIENRPDDEEVLARVASGSYRRATVRIGQLCQEKQWYYDVGPDTADRGSDALVVEPY